MPKQNQSTKKKSDKPRCGLCGSSRKKLIKTECCGNWICDDEDKYVLFSYARNSCHRNHRRFTLCGFHHANGHKGDWRGCKECLDSFSHEMEMYAWYGTNEYNFEKLENPPKFEPTHCWKCGKVIVLPEGGYSSLCNVYICGDCDITEEEREKIIKTYKKSK